MDASEKTKYKLAGAVRELMVFTPVDRITDYMAGSKGYLEGNGDGYTMLNLFSEKDPKAKGVTPVKQNVGTYRDAMQNFIQKNEDALEAVKAKGHITDIDDE